MLYRINVEHNEPAIEKKIESRNQVLYPTKVSYVLAAIKDFENCQNKNSSDISYKLDAVLQGVSKILEKENQIEDELPEVFNAEDFYK